MSKGISIELEPVEREAILKYGYPFDDLEGELKKHQSVDSEVVVEASFFDWEQAVGQLSISVNHNGRDGNSKLQESTLLMLDEVASLIEREIGI